MSASVERDPPRQPPRGDRLIALFFFGAVCFSPPLLRVFGSAFVVGGLPLLAVYLFLVWAVLIILVALHVEGRAPPRPGQDRR